MNNKNANVSAESFWLNKNQRAYMLVSYNRIMAYLVSDVASVKYSIYNQKREVLDANWNIIVDFYIHFSQNGQIGKVSKQ